MKSNSVISTAITNFQEKYVGNKTVTFYEIKVTDNTTNKSWEIERRYTDFKNLYTALTSFIPNCPIIPSGTLFKVTSQEALNKRKEGLETFLIMCTKQDHILFTSEFLNFLEVEKNLSNIKQLDAELFFQYSKLPLGLRDFKIYEKKGVLFVCCSDMNIVSRADSVIANFNFFGNDKNRYTGNDLPLGAFFVYQFEKNFKNPNERFIVHKIWAKTFLVQTGCLFFDEDSELFGVGLDDGKICVFHDPEDTHFVKSQILFELNSLHKDRVTGLAYDNKKKAIYSCSSDWTFYVTQLKEKKVEPMLVRMGDSGYTGLFFDKDNDRVITTNKLGEISIFLTKPDIITETCKIQTTPLNTIRALNYNSYNNYIFTGTINGKITVTNLGMAGKEKLMSEISSFGLVDMVIRVCCFWEKTYQLFTGDEAGRITVWDLKVGKLIKIWMGHSMAITQMYFDEQRLFLYTGSKDKLIKVWKIPERWITEESDKSKIIESLIPVDVKDQIKPEDYDSDDSDYDDLNGWDYRKK